MASSTSSTATRRPSTASSSIPAIKAVSFVGSTPIAEYVYTKGTSHGKRVQALGGAKNHMIVMPDADLDQAADALVGAAYGSAGERCMAISVAVAVGNKTADDLIARLKPRIAALSVAPGMEPGAELGPLVTGAHLERVKSYIALGQTEGAELVIDGREPIAVAKRRRLLPRRLLVRPRQAGDAHLSRRRSSGRCWASCAPRTSIRRSASINEHEFGNGTSIFTRDGDTARAFAHNVQAGMVGINVPIPVPMAFHSFGGWKRSLFGDHAVHGVEGVRFYTRLKTVTARWPTGIRVGVDTTMPTLG